MHKLMTICILSAALSGCALLTIPIKVAGKVTTKAATTTVKATGKAAAAGVKAAIPEGEEDVAE